MFEVRRRMITAVVAGVVGGLHVSAALGHEFKAGDLTVLHPVIRVGNIAPSGGGAWAGAFVGLSMAHWKVFTGPRAG